MWLWREAMKWSFWGRSDAENDPEAVAAAFSNVIARYRKCFKTIELAIYCSPRDEQNYNIFKREIDTTLR